MPDQLPNPPTPLSPVILPPPDPNPLTPVIPPVPITPPTSTSSIAAPTIPAAPIAPPFIPPAIPQNPPPEITPPPPPSVPLPPTGMNSPSKKLIFFIGGAILLVILLMVVIVGMLPKTIKGGPGSAATGNSLVPQISLSKYDKDTDADFIPDEIEKAISFNAQVSEFERCKPASCSSSDKTNIQSAQKNILFIIDNSGSMIENIGGQTKMDLAKDAIKKFIQAADQNVKIGILVYGHQGSNSASSKSISCASAEVIGTIGTVTASSIDTYLNQMKPVGWTPIGLAIRKGQEAFAGKEGQKNQIIVVTDGNETCDTNPIAAATEAKTSPLNIQVDVIGFAVSAKDQASLQSISTNGGGVFSLANNSDDLLNQFKSSAANFKAYMGDVTCINKVYTASSECLIEVQSKSGAYLNSLSSAARGSEATKINEIRTIISREYGKEADRLNKEWISLKADANQKLLK